MSYDVNNVFAKIIRGQIPCNKIYEDDEVLAFHDISKAAPVHVLVIPKGEFRNFADFASNAKSGQVENFFKKVAQIAQSLGVADSGYRLISNSGPDASQSVDHFHVHILAKKKLGGLVAGDKTH